MTVIGREIYGTILLIILTIIPIVSTKKLVDTKDKKLATAYSTVDILCVLNIIFVVNQI